ncbi:hypothetical protein AMTRI_Chr11g93540 [Amborella trichopoda]
MRDLVPCLSESAVQLSSPSSSSSPSSQNMVTCLYEAELSGEPRLVTITWCKNLMGHGLSVNITDSSNPRGLDTKPTWPMWKKRGMKNFRAGEAHVEVHWDLSSAKYGPSPEPIENYYVAMVSDHRLVLLLGDMNREAIDRSKAQLDEPRSGSDASGSFEPGFRPRLIWRKEHVFGKNLYSTRARFNESGKAHDIVIECFGEKGSNREPRLCVRIDKKMVVHVKRLLWKFRGNQTILVDGSPIDMLWDVHDWFFSPGPSGYAVFMFKTKMDLGIQTWVSENKLRESHERGGFSLLIYAWKNQ